MYVSRKRQQSMNLLFSPEARSFILCGAVHSKGYSVYIGLVWNVSPERSTFLLQCEFLKFRSEFQYSRYPDDVPNLEVPGGGGFVRLGMRVSCGRGMVWCGMGF